MRKKYTKNKIYTSQIIIVATMAFFGLFEQVHAQDLTAKGIINAANASRSAFGLPTLTESELLDEIAQQKAQDMIDNDYFAHTSPKGITPWYWFEENGYDFKYAGENLAIHFRSLEDQHRAWMESPTHRKNILGSQFLETGTAVARGVIGGKETTVAVQVFGTKSVDASLVILKGDTQLYSSKDGKEIAGVSVGRYAILAKDEINKLDMMSFVFAFSGTALIGIDAIMRLRQRMIRNLFVVHTIQSH